MTFAAMVVREKLFSLKQEVKIMKRKLIIALAICLVMVLTGCTEADKVNYNMSQQAQYF